MADIVFISYIFPPYNSIASQRSAKIVLNLLNSYDTVHVFTLTVNSIPKSKLDRDLYSELLSSPRVKIVQIPLSAWGYEDPSSASLPVRLLSGMLTRVLCSNGFFWYAPLKKGLTDFLSIQKPAAVIATGPPFIIFHLVYKLSLKFHFKYVLDFRDLWTSNPRTPFFKIARSVIGKTFERQAINNAAAITTVSRGCAASILKSSGVNPSKMFIVHNSPDQDYIDRYQGLLHDRTESDDKKILVYFVGTVYENCTFWPVLEALKGLEPYKRDLFELHYYGSSSQLVLEEFATYQMSHLLIDHGYVSKTESMKALSRADLFISLVDDGRQPQDDSISGIMTTKIFDYFLTGKPVLNIGPEGSDVAEFANSTYYKYFFSYQANEIGQIRQFLSSFDPNDYSERIITHIPTFEKELEKLYTILN